MLIPGFDALNQSAKKKLIENASKDAMQIMLNQNFNVMSRYLTEHGLEPFDFITEEDMDAVGMTPKASENEGEYLNRDSIACKINFDCCIKTCK